MSTTEYQQRIAAMRQMLETQAPNISLRMATTGLTLVKERSIRDGITVDGAFAEYSANEVYKSSFKNKTLNSAGSAYASSGGKGTYGELRKVQGRKSDHVNLFYRGRMWTSLRIISQTQNGFRYSVLVGPSDDEATQILIANIKRYGNFLKLNAEEQRLLLADAEADVQDIINQFL
ncbi:hypothetical protein [Spirosoma litoris]